MLEIPCSRFICNPDLVALIPIHASSLLKIPRTPITPSIYLHPDWILTRFTPQTVSGVLAFEAWWCGRDVNISKPLIAGLWFIHLATLEESSYRQVLSTTTWFTLYLCFHPLLPLVTNQLENHLRWWWWEGCHMYFRSCHFFLFPFSVIPIYIIQTITLFRSYAWNIYTFLCSLRT